MLKTQLQRQQQRKSQPQPQPQLQPWESRSTLSESLAGLGTRLSRIWLQQPSNTSALSLPSSLADNDYDDSDDRMFINKNADSAADATSYTRPRSQSRGRDAFHSSGRGGVGNIRRTSTSRDPAPPTPPRTARDGPDDYSQTRGREMNVTPAITHSGRGGAGNIRSPSRGPASPSSLPPSSQYEKDIIRQYSERDVELPHSSGRGGAGNITSSASPLAAIAAAADVAKSRSRSGVRSSGRGGAGNMVSPTTTTDNRDIAMLDELERLKHHQHYQHQHPDGIHSTGRGGAANLTSAPYPGIDLPPIHESQPGDVEHLAFSSGRGGAGNIRQASGSRTRGD